MATKKVYRSHKDQIIGGVCGGLAEYFDIDATWIRLAFVLTFFAGGSGLLAYIVAWIIIPEKPATYNTRRKEQVDNGEIVVSEGEEESIPEFLEEEEDEDSSEKQKILGFVLIAIGGVFFIDNWFPFFSWERFWPVMIILLGAGLLYKGVKERG